MTVPWWPASRWSMASARARVVLCVPVLVESSALSIACRLRSLGEVAVESDESSRRRRGNDQIGPSQRTTRSSYRVSYYTHVGVWSYRAFCYLVHVETAKRNAQSRRRGPTSQQQPNGHATTLDTHHTPSPSSPRQSFKVSLVTMYIVRMCRNNSILSEKHND
jgi:hypothetical protein